MRDRSVAQPAPAVRRDWEATREQLRRDDAVRAARRLERVRRGNARSALAFAEQAFPPTPVAAKFERRFRDDYIEYVAQTATYLSAREFAAVRSRSRDLTARAATTMLVFLCGVVCAVAAVVASWTSMLTGLLLIALAVVVGLVAGLFVGAVVSVLHRLRSERMFADRFAYFRWVDGVKAPASVCVCQSRDRAHDAGCPALILGDV